MQPHAQSEHDIEVVAKTRFLPEQSDPARQMYTFAYTIKIQNRGCTPAQLLSRHWIVTDADGKVQEVRGQGVVGEQPLIHPGEVFEYTSGTRLQTPIGSMHGSYQMLAADGTRFNAEIRPFSLGDRSTLH
ncbi:MULTISPECIES: Co2+/Mg2+ efflux protein ApaG [Thiorhodovibrio]|uniref:Co2+/Mg2+ efflux protein ApaG n=1 Tax=Thiorhodovibrio TaxID=61593 RepID=UPI0019137276|nr:MULTISPECIES: Co2+/Mg2+ efflux protein ApaG [Thiorhodovibrio]MBK5968284.1 Co2+/Mg2+ efflux protein ApaG [Thiorhodovibrio winogradskyi]WPL13012.1 CO2+/MG2+ efflux protein ApaG [Thiorhodovibrio litoralis]